MDRLKPALVLAAAALVIGAALLLRRAPAPPTSDPRPTAAIPAEKGTSTPPAPAPAPAPAAAEGNDAMGIPLDPARIAQGVADKVKEHGEILARLKGPLADAERADLELRASRLASEVDLWTARLADHKDWRHRDLFAALFTGSPWFKDAAAGYLAALPDDAGLGVLLDGLRGDDLYARAAAAVALDPHLKERRELPEALRSALRKALSDDLSRALEDEAEYGHAKAAAKDLAESLRGVAVRALARFKDGEAIPLLLDVETGKDGVAWRARSPEDADLLGRHLVEGLRASPSPLALERLAAVVDAHLKPKGPLDEAPPGSPASAALMLDALGQPAKLRELREHHQKRFAAARQEDVGLEEAARLLDLRDARPVDWLLERLTSPRAQVRNRAVNILIEATRQATPASVEFEGEGSAEDRARWERARQAWAEWWTTQREKFQLTNPYR